MLSQESHFTYNETDKLKAKRQKKIYCADINQRKAGMTLVNQIKKTSEQIKLPETQMDTEE